VRAQRQMTLVTLIATVGIAGCKDSSKNLTGPSDGFVTRVQVTGPASIAPGEAAVLTAVGTYPDGTTKDISAEAVWTSTNPSAVSVDRSGRATAVERGEAIISARLQQRGGVLTVVAVPAGTYKVAGTVVDAGGVGVPLADTLVEAGSGAAALTTRTDRNGRYALYGVTSGSVLRVSRDDYVTDLRTLEMSGTTVADVQLALARPRLDIAGTYTLTLGPADCDASPALDPSLRQRSYTAVISQNGANAEVTLTGPEFAAMSSGFANQFSGTVGASGAVFDIRAADGYYLAIAAVVEVLPEGTFLSIWGSAATSVKGAGLAGTLDGVLLHTRSTPGGALIGRCIGKIPFVLSR
jgi:hypothetical protein